jgi:hypothetical protein
MRNCYLSDCQEYKHLTSAETNLCSSWFERVSNEALIGPSPLLPLFFSMCSYESLKESDTTKKAWASTGTRDRSSVSSSADSIGLTNSSSSVVRRVRQRGTQVLEEGAREAAFMGLTRSGTGRPTPRDATESLMASTGDVLVSEYAVTNLLSWRQETEIVRMRVATVFKEITSLRIQNPSRKW